MELLKKNQVIANKYIIQEKIGNGSFGSIYKGTNQRTNECNHRQRTPFVILGVVP